MPKTREGEILNRIDELRRERHKWTNKLKNQRMRYIRWLDKIEPIDDELRQLERELDELQYGSFLT